MDDEFDRRSVEELEDEIAGLSAHIDVAPTARLLRAIAQLDRREGWATGFESSAHWLSWRVVIDMVTARQRIASCRFRAIPSVGGSLTPSQSIIFH
jgi:hypothetical protein